MEIPHSTEERYVGTWYNGKKIYERTFMYENRTLNAKQETRIEHAINNIEDIIDLKVLTKLGWEASWCTEAYLAIDVGIITKATARELAFINRSSNNWTFNKLQTIIRYTKTTD